MYTRTCTHVSVLMHVLMLTRDSHMGEAAAVRPIVCCWDLIHVQCSYTVMLGLLYPKNVACRWNTARHCSQVDTEAESMLRRKV